MACFNCSCTECIKDRREKAQRQNEIQVRREQRLLDNPARAKARALRICDGDYTYIAATLGISRCQAWRYCKDIPNDRNWSGPRKDDQ